MTTLAQRRILRSTIQVGRITLPYFVGMCLFYIYMFIPARLQDLISIFRLPFPVVAMNYGIGYPYFPILDLIIFVYAGFLWVHYGCKIQKRISAFRIYVVTSLICVCFLWIRFLQGYEQEMFWDSAIMIVRLVAIYWLFVSIPNDAASWGKILQGTLALLFVSSFLLNRAGYANPNTPSNDAGRMTASGFDFSTTSYFGFVLALSSLTLSRGIWQIVLFLIGLGGAVMGGGRNPLPFFLGCLLFLALQRKRVGRFLIWVVPGVGVVLILVMILSPGVLNRLPTFNRDLDYSVYYSSGVTPTDDAQRYFPFLAQFSISDPAIVGRFNTWSSALVLIESRGLVPLASDWNVQQKLITVGVPSHSHNGYLQTLLKFGILALPFWGAVAASLLRGLRSRSPYSILILFLLASLLVDYWLLVIKAAFLFFALIKLNDDWVSQDSRKRTASMLGSGA